MINTIKKVHEFPNSYALRYQTKDGKTWGSVYGPVGRIPSPYTIKIFFQYSEDYP